MHPTSGRFRHSFVHACCAVWLCALSVPRLAAQDKAPTSTPSPQEAARAAYSRGVEAFSAQNYPLAHEQFSLAEEAFPSPNIELMLGRSLMKLGRWLDARTVLQRAQAGTGPKYANAARLATEELALAEKQLARLELEIADVRGDERLTINGNAVEPAAWKQPIELDPGPVRIELSRPGAPKTEKQLVLGPGAKERVALSLPAPEPAPVAKAKKSKPPARAAIEATQPLPPPPEATPKTQEARSPWLRGLSYALAGVGVAGFAGFAGFGVYSHDHYEKLEELCPAGTDCHPSYRWLATKGQTYQTLANVSLVAGSVALAAGVTLWIVTLSPGRAEVEVTGNSVRIRGSF